MGSLIKSSLLHSLDRSQEYLVDTKSELDAARHYASPEEEAQSIVDKAKLEAEALLAQAQSEVDSIREKAHAEGYQAGLSALDADREALQQKAAEIEADATSQAALFWRQIEPELLKLSVEIARKVVRREIDEHSDFVITTVREAIRQLRDRQDLKIHVSPKDYDLVRERKDEIQSSSDGIRSIEVIDDRRIDQGGCLIESGNGHLDARTETQMGEAERALLEAERYDNSNDTSES